MYISLGTLTTVAPHLKSREVSWCDDVSFPYETTHSNPCRVSMYIYNSWKLSCIANTKFELFVKFKRTWHNVSFRFELQEFLTPLWPLCMKDIPCKVKLGQVGWVVSTGNLWVAVSTGASTKACNNLWVVAADWPFKIQKVDLMHVWMNPGLQPESNRRTLRSWDCRATIPFQWWSMRGSFHEALARRTVALPKKKC